MPKLMIVIASTRPGRVGLPVGRWFEAHARAHGAFEIEVADLAEIELPFMDEPNHPDCASTPSSTRRPGVHGWMRPTHSRL